MQIKFFLQEKAVTTKPSLLATSLHPTKAVSAENNEYENLISHNETAPFNNIDEEYTTTTLSSKFWVVLKQTIKKDKST